MFHENSSPGNGHSQEIWHVYRQEIMRWNRQFNLVSRALGESDVSRLIRQSLDAARSIPDLFSQLHQGSRSHLFGSADPPGRGNIEKVDISRVTYLDIGSGAGIPGLVWHHWMSEDLEKKPAPARPLLRSALFEPRWKRAWFLQRAVRKMGLDGVEVWNRRWADATQTEFSSRVEGPSYWIVSLKALKMPDSAVISGWRRVTGLSQLGEGDRLLICRFRPPLERLEPSLIRDLDLPPPPPPLIQAESSSSNSCAMLPCGPKGDPGANLLGSWYSCLPESV